jgi:hypothetical protein
MKEVKQMKYLPSIFAVAAIWLMTAPFALGYKEITAAMQNDIAVGAVILIAAFFWGYRELKEDGWNVRVHADRKRT